MIDLNTLEKKFKLKIDHQYRCLSYALCLWNEDTILLDRTTNILVWRHSFCSSLFLQWWLLAKRTIPCSSTRIQARRGCIYLLLYAHSLRLMTMTTSSSTARRTIDVTYKPINRKKSSHFAYTRAHVKASEQGLSLLPLVRIVLVTSIRNHYMLLNEWRKTTTKKKKKKIKIHLINKK